MELTNSALEAEVEPPLTTEVVHAIQRHRVMPADPRLMQTYFQQLVHTIAWRRGTYARIALP